MKKPCTGRAWSRVSVNKLSGGAVLAGLPAISGDVCRDTSFLFTGMNIPVKPECRAGLCITVSVRPCGPATVREEQPAQTEFTGAVTEVSAPGAEVIVGYGTAARRVCQRDRIDSGLAGISRNMAHQLSACCSCSAITHKARLSLTSPSIPLTARVWLRLPFAVRPGRPPLIRFSWMRW